jgi:hypothetical protein
MPQPATKRKKGRAPAHQNAFAFKHNPKSKKTDAILNSPNIHVCRRCHDKIEWRKKYRKYKPRTQPGKCNLCLQRNVKAAYHTICTDCTTSERAKKELFFKEEIENGTSSTTGKGEETDTLATVHQISQAIVSKLTIENTDEKKNVCHRVCAMCTKEPALPDEDDGESAGIEDLVGNRKLKLRERRALERKLAKEQAEAASKNQENTSNENDDTCMEQQCDNDGGSNCNVNHDSSDVEETSDIEDDLIKAVGGEDKLLTGEAYQLMLLEREKHGVTAS